MKNLSQKDQDLAKDRILKFLIETGQTQNLQDIATHVGLSVDIVHSLVKNLIKHDQVDYYEVKELEMCGVEITTEGKRFSQSTSFIELGKKDAEKAMLEKAPMYINTFVALLALASLVFSIWQYSDNKALEKRLDAIESNMK
jgi:predicted transcriptional regulator